MRAQDLILEISKAAGALIHAKEENTWLFILRGEYVDHPFTWGLPGGRGSYSEKYIETAIRETKEEIGFDLTDCPAKLIYIHKTDWPLTVYKTFAFQVEKQFKPILDWESADYKWCPLDQLPEPMHWGVEAMLNNDLSGEILHKWLQSLI